ncbi:rab-3-interacting molecule unc-10-like isoform X2 [Penaeus japonicus]|uniref:rab-3-interacting molecule unc-10-like isoform X2 n=1 Tax=Penaeus japonicus TaxID=27405 RepID=UPI001C7105A9|nr:rab-3-interacting molecule unc-10-like isoform X2 [Penaeus japonicus]
MATTPFLALRLQLVLLLLSHALQVFSAEFTHDRKRIGPLESVRAEYGCLKKFDVSEKTIIRTQDSQDLGAKFLEESDVGNREDCLSLCCKTPHCNVAVFEEKESGSCYLFDCGQPVDIKCKFNTHSHYTSAVLRVNRHQLELSLWSEQSQHEAELANLRSSSELEESLPVQSGNHVSPTTFPTPSSKLPTTTTTTAVTTTTTTEKPTPPPARQCGRFQFRCNSGECIAVYNVCDGIPQCQDKSDEGHDCPSVSTESVPSSLQPVDAAPPPSMHGQSYGYPSQIFSHRPNVLDNYNHRQAAAQGPADEPQQYRGPGRPSPNYYDYNTRPGWQSGPRYNAGELGAGGMDYVGQEAHRPFPYPDYGSQQPQQPLQQQQQPLQQRPVWMDQPNYPMQPQQQQQHQHQHQQQQQPPAQQQQQHLRPQVQDRHMQNSVPSLKFQQQQLQQQPPLQQQQMSQMPQLPQLPQLPQSPYQQHPVLNQRAPGGLAAQGNLQDTELGMVSERNGQGATNQLPVPSAPRTTHSTVRPSTLPSTASDGNTSNGSNAGSTTNKVKNGSAVVTSVLSDNGRTHIMAHASLARLEVNDEQLEMEAREQDAQASGAVLALAMGVCITALLVVLVGCRLRGVRRRLRRHRGSKSLYAHDADYLVNGMYL